MITSRKKASDGPTTRKIGKSSHRLPSIDYRLILSENIHEGPIPAHRHHGKHINANYSIRKYKYIYIFVTTKYFYQLLYATAGVVDEAPGHVEPVLFGGYPPPKS